MSRAALAPRLTLFMREAWKNIRNAPVLTVVAVLTIAVSLILVGFFGFVMSNTGRLLDSVAKDLTITVYLHEGVTAETVDAVMANVKEGAEEHRYVATFLTPEEVRERTLELLTPELLEGLDEAALPAQPAIEIQLEPRTRRKADFDRITGWLDGLEGVEGVQTLLFSAEKVRIIFAITDLIKVTGLIIVIIVLAAAVFFTFSTIKLAVHARRSEIEVLRLVGATNGFIRAPFFIEGALAGFLGSVTALLIVAYIRGRLTDFVEEAHFLNISLDLMPPGMVLWLLFGGVALGLAGSALSVGRYLK